MPLFSIFEASTTVQGYGYLDEISALYGLIWNTPKFMMGFIWRLYGKPNKAGMCPNMAGMCPNIAGMYPNIAGMYPNIAGMYPNIAGMCPNIAGMYPNMAGMYPNIAGMCPNIAGMLNLERKEKISR